MARQSRSFFDLAYSWVPFGLTERKPRHFREMFKIIWRNRDNLGYAWKVLNRGVCDGCALGTSGLSDWTIDGTHLCLVRLNLLRLNTMPALNHELLEDAAEFRKNTSKEMRDLGRLAYPMRRRKGEKGFARVTWEELWADVGARWRKYEPNRTSMFVTSRGVTNEVYYTAQKVMRFLGTNNVDNSARLCHSPSTSGLKTTLGVAATTCSYRDFYETDLIVFFGSNPANDQPVTLKYLLEARKKGARVVLVNAFREPGMERYWVPSNLDSALFGTKMSDRLFMVKIGGDMAFLNAVAKVLIEKGWHKQEFIDNATTGFAALKRTLDQQPMDALLQQCGLKLEDVEAFAQELANAERGIFIWSMGITQHHHGADTVRALVNLGMLREYVGRPGTGMMPIRGHSGVQGGAEMGAYSTVFPGGVPISVPDAEHFSKLWGFPVPSTVGLTTVDTLESAFRGEIDAFYCIGGNFLETMPDPDHIEAALKKIPLRIHSDIVVTNQMLVEPADTVYILPTRTRYEQRDGGTETSTERRVIYSPYIPGHDLGESRSEWEMLLDLAKAVKPESYDRIHFENGAAIRADIERAVPSYAGISKLSKQGDQFQWGGPHLCADRKFKTDDGKAHFQPVTPPSRVATRNRKENSYVLATRRGKQFNSMIQSDYDALTGAERDHIFISPDDAAKLGLHGNEAIVLTSTTGSYKGRAFLADVTPGTLQGHWPEVNVLIPNGIVDPFGGVPDYNAEVSIARA